MNNPHDPMYLSALRSILEQGERRVDRTGVGTISVFGTRQVYDLTETFPALTTKKLAWRAVVSELLWFIEGSGDERRLAEILHGSRDAERKTIWTANAEADYWLPKAKFPGDLGRVYGVQWRSWLTPSGTVVDQLSNLIAGIKRDPYGRRHILSAWNVGELDQMALPPCHMLAQFYVRGGNYLDCQINQRSNDMFLGCPFNIASYALLTHMIAHVTGYLPGRLLHITGDAHIYENHVDQVREQLTREPRRAPVLVLNINVNNIFDFTMDDVHLLGYESHPAIKAPMAV